VPEVLRAGGFPTLENLRATRVNDAAVGQAGARAAVAQSKKARMFSKKHPAKTGEKSRAATTPSSVLVAPAPHSQTSNKKVPRALACLGNFNTSGDEEVTTQEWDSLRPQELLTPMDRGQLITDPTQLRVLAAEEVEAACSPDTSQGLGS
jgi:hypothetical protein